MPSHQPTNRPAPAHAPTAKQLRSLRRLATASGQSFAYPATKAQASGEIKRLIAEIARNPSFTCYRADVEQARELGIPEDAVQVREDEVDGYGADAHWVHTRDRRPEDQQTAVPAVTRSSAGERRELARYRLPDGTERALIAQRINGCVAITDTPTDDTSPERVYLVERHIESQAAMAGLTGAYIKDSIERGEPAILVPRELAEERS